VDSAEQKSQTASSNPNELPMKKISKDKKRALFGFLEFGISLGFGFWDLGFPK
jgi:hypothetical protein